MAGTRFDDGDPGAADPADRASCRPDAMILCYPVITMRGPYRHEGSLRNLLGPEPDPDMVASLSGEAQVSAKTPPAFLWHTADDPVAVENSLMIMRSPDGIAAAGAHDNRSARRTRSGSALRQKRHDGGTVFVPISFGQRSAIRPQQFPGRHRIQAAPSRSADRSSQRISSGVSTISAASRHERSSASLRGPITAPVG